MLFCSAAASFSFTSGATSVLLCVSASCSVPLFSVSLSASAFFRSSAPSAACLPTVSFSCICTVSCSTACCASFFPHAVSPRQHIHMPAATTVFLNPSYNCLMLILLIRRKQTFPSHLRSLPPEDLCKFFTDGRFRVSFRLHFRLMPFFAFL